MSWSKGWLIMVAAMVLVLPGCVGMGFDPFFGDPGYSRYSDYYGEPSYYSSRNVYVNRTVVVEQPVVVKRPAPRPDDRRDHDRWHGERRDGGPDQAQAHRWGHDQGRPERVERHSEASAPRLSAPAPRPASSHRPERPAQAPGPMQNPAPGR